MEADTNLRGSSSSSTPSSPAAPPLQLHRGTLRAAAESSVLSSTHTSCRKGFLHQGATFRSSSLNTTNEPIQRPIVHSIYESYVKHKIAHFYMLWKKNTLLLFALILLPCLLQTRENVYQPGQTITRVYLMAVSKCSNFIFSAMASAQLGSRTTGI